MQPEADLAESPHAGRGLTLALAIGLVVCALLAVGAVVYAQKQIATLTQAPRGRRQVRVGEGGCSAKHVFIRALLEV